MTDITESRPHAGVVIDHGSDAANSRNERLIFGFWIFLMSDAVLFSLLFATYGVMWDATAGGPGPSDIVSVPHAFIETMVLLFSSLTSGFISIAMERRRSAGLIAFWLLVTLALGGCFIALELSEFLGLIAEGHTPADSGYLSAFFVLVGTHGLHVSAGILWGSILLLQIVVKGVNAHVSSRLLRFCLYWHFLDIVWIGIFTFVYLAGSLQ